MKTFRIHRDLPILLKHYARRKESMISGTLIASVALLLGQMTTAVAVPESLPVPAAQTAGQATDNSAGGSDESKSAPKTLVEPHFFIREYRVVGGGHLLPQVDVEAAVYPYLGPYRTKEDVEQARGALEQAYRDKGYQTVTVQIPPQSAKSGVVFLEVMRGEVGRLRVYGSRYFSIDEIKREAPSLQEGQSPNFSQVTHDLLVLNDISDRRVTPTVRAGEVPGTVDVDLNVKDTLPLHGSLEINNRDSADTTPLRLNASVSYDNLWQLEHSIGFSFQLSPENPQQVKVFSGFYSARIPDVDWLTLVLNGTKQDSDVSTLGGIGVAGRGDTVGGTAVFLLPGQKGFYHSFSLSFDYKHFTQDANEPGSSALISPLTTVTYYLLSPSYSATWMGKGYETDLNASVNLSFRGLGSDEAVFANNRAGTNGQNAEGNFIYFRGDLSHTRDLPDGFQLFVKGQSQVADEPLVNSEQFSAGGLGTVRGLLESEVLGDNGILGTVELRSPSLGDFIGKEVNDWRVYIFSDGGVLTQNQPLLDTPYEYNLLSVGAGTRFKLASHINGSLDMGIPLVVDSLESGVSSNTYVQNPIQEEPYDVRMTFRLWAEF